MSISSTHRLPRSLAIAGAWGYIGRKFLDVALAHGIKTYVFDPGPTPADIDPCGIDHVADELQFHALDAEVFHLAVHPEHRRLELLLGRPKPVVVLNEKPMALPERPEDCPRIVTETAGAHATVLYDFPELYDPITDRILARLASFRSVNIDSIDVQRSKDREDPANPRNFKRMVAIQYQESVHCLAFVLQILGAVRGGARAAVDAGVSVVASSEPYAPPNPEDYPTAVDGRCRFQAEFAGTRVRGLTDFKRNAPWAKLRTIRGVGDGVPFTIEASYLEGRKWLRFDGVDQPCDPKSCSYESVLRTLTRWTRTQDRAMLMSGPYPNPAFARLTYQLSSALWRSSRDRSPLVFGSADELESFGLGE